METNNETYGFTKQEWDSCIKVLTALKDAPFNNPDNATFGTLITKIYKKAKKENRKESYKAKKEHDKAIINASVISKNAIQNHTFYTAEEYRKDSFFRSLKVPKNCYCCNTSFTEAHSFYNRLCPDCATLNYENRFKEVDLSGRNVIITGGRVKIGYATALKLLRNQANVTITTRFPGLALAEFKKENDYDVWKNNVTIYGLDLRNLKEVEAFVDYYKLAHDSLEILINNAAQTIKYTSDYYAPLIEREKQYVVQYKSELQLIENKTAVAESTLLESHTNEEFVSLNRFGQPVDNRSKNSWNATLQEVDMVELLEVNLINQISPYFLIKELSPLLRASSFKKKFISNVTSSEGQFSYTNKTAFHPHTNMTKASLNMLTRTAALEFEKDHIYMNAIDVGWVSTGANETLREKQFEKGYIPPLDPVDGASRIMVPIVEAIKKDKNISGKLLKNYKIEDW